MKMTNTDKRRSELEQKIGTALAQEITRIKQVPIDCYDVSTLPEKVLGSIGLLVGGVEGVDAGLRVIRAMTSNYDKLYDSIELYSASLFAFAVTWLGVTAIGGVAGFGLGYMAALSVAAHKRRRRVGSDITQLMKDYPDHAKDIRDYSKLC